METLLLAVGKLRPWCREACDEYLHRLRRYGAVRETEVREAGKAGSPSLARKREAEHLRAALPPGRLVVALDQGGAPWPSDELARRLGAWRDSGRNPVFVIGGAHGLEPEFVAAAPVRWSLGPLTLPHELARVIVLEQWYRAWTILRRERYHKG